MEWVSTPLGTWQKLSNMLAPGSMLGAEDAVMPKNIWNECVQLVLRRTYRIGLAMTAGPRSQRSGKLETAPRVAHQHRRQEVATTFNVLSQDVELTGVSSAGRRVMHMRFMSI
jgi:hypothetical protein